MDRLGFLESIKEQYDLVSVLSSKNSGSVIRMRHRSLKRDMVVRFYDASLKAYRLIKDLEIPGIPLIYDVAELSDGQAILEEYVDGITVSQVLESGKYTYKGASKVIKELCRPLSVLHSLGIVHRDIKPENIIIGTKGKVFLIDLNASRTVKENSTKDTHILGTLGYAPPEQFGISQSDKRADIYALGVLLNVMLTGAHPGACLAKGKAGRIVLKCTSIDPNKRFPCVESLALAL